MNAFVKKVLDLRGVTFLCPNKKVTKEVVWGEALTGEAFRYYFDQFTLYPDFKPPSPQTPYPAPVENLAVIFF